MSLSDESVECIKSIDLSEEFSSWHIKWTVGKITDNDLGKLKDSPYFYLPPSDRYSLFPCRLSIWLPAEDARDLLIQISAQNISFPIPMIYRFALSHDGNQKLMTNSYVDVRLEHFAGMPHLVDTDGSLFKRNSNPVVHCWLDIPSVIMKKMESHCRSIQSFPVPSNIRNFLKKSEALYESTMGPNRFASHSDVTLVLSGISNGRFYCHRSILAFASPVFAKMFSTTEWKEGEDGTVDIDDIDEKTMQAVLYHIYTGQLKKAESDDLPNLIYAADKYQLKDLKSRAEIQLMVDECTDSERINCLQFAERHQLRQLRAACIAMLSTNMRLMASDEIKEKLSQEMREELIEAVEKRQMNTIQIDPARRYRELI